MYIEDKNWKGARCRMCCAPVKDKEQISDAIRIEEKMNKEQNTNYYKPTYFCSNACIYAKYVG